MNKFTVYLLQLYIQIEYQKNYEQSVDYFFLDISLFT